MLGKHLCFYIAHCVTHFSLAHMQYLLHFKMTCSNGGVFFSRVVIKTKNSSYEVKLEQYKKREDATKGLTL